MGYKVIFKLKEPQSDIVSPSLQRETLIYLFFNYGYYELDESGNKKYKPLKYSTGKTIKPYYWIDRPTYRPMSKGKVDHQSIKERLDFIQATVIKIYEEYESEGLLPSPDELRKRLSAKIKPVPVRPKLTLTTYLEDLTTKVSEGKRLTEKGTVYKRSSARNFKGLQQQLELFYRKTGKRIDFNDVTVDFYNDFLKFFTDKKGSPNTVGKHIKTLKTVMRLAFEEKPPLHQNVEFSRKVFKAISAEVENIYLTEDELEKIAALDLSDDPVKDRARDVFLVGCHTAQRFSDYSRISKSNIRQLSSTRKVIDLVQAKTGEKVTIPIRPELERILRKYDYTLPKTYEQKVNFNIKKVAEKAGLTDIVHFEETRGGMRRPVSKAKFELIKTHTARRTGATNMYLAGISTLDIMKITGHRTEKEFLKYIKVTKDETAHRLGKSKYFNKLYKVAK